ncbi:COG3400 family protein [Campylobacter gastrosuis]|uniref:NAD-binding protein n=1 Tax=Campylobacter gastrosuis TaxID=2974576 RepID=A0ABT7HP05_9BACT|nr:TrkA C-terminal domain-containing protein [Campylobacter gastrosuis]MDL0088661.1 NAD-binding protein [Campylobacter gastrosuis]
MKKILIIANGEISRHFIKRLDENRSNLHEYTVVSNSQIEQINAHNFKFYLFDATSLSKLNAVIDGYFSQFIIAVDDKNESIEIYKNLRKISTKTEIVMLTLWEIDEWLKDDKHLEFVDGKDVLAFRVIHHLPDMPVIADNIGLSEGEIMEVKVPITSSYAHRHITSIPQRKWRIALIYRSNEIILPKPGVMIRPNDTLLIVGYPNVLRSVFSLIKREKGHFPNPFGNNIFTFIDMRLMSDECVKRLINESLYLNSKLNNKKVIFSVINPTLNENLRTLRGFKDDNIIVNIDYFNQKKFPIKDELKVLEAGLVVTTNEYFLKFKKRFYELILPILKIGDLPLESIKSGVILSDEKEKVENQSAVILDFCSQLNINTRLYYFNDNSSNEAEIIEHFESLNTLFDKKIEVRICKDKNPLTTLTNASDLIQFIPFDESVKNAGKFSFLSMDLNKQYQKLSHNHQLFLPIE